MDRNYIVKVCNDYYIKKDVSSVNTVLSDYCINHGKKSEDIQKFLSYIFSTMSWMPFFEYALEYYKRKYAIYELQILGIGTNIFDNSKRILLYY